MENVGKVVGGELRGRKFKEKTNMVARLKSQEGLNRDRVTK